MNELIKVEENTLIVAEKVVEQIKDFERKKKIIEEKEKAFKDLLMEKMQEYGLSSYESPDKTLKISYTPENEVMIFDSTRFKEEHPATYLEYQKPSVRKGSIRMTIRGDKE